MVTVTIVATPGPAQDLVLGLFGVFGPFEHNMLRFAPVSYGEAQAIVNDLGRRAGNSFDIVVEPSIDGKYVLIRVTEAKTTRRGEPVPPPRARATRARRVEPVEPVAEDEDEVEDVEAAARGSGRDWWSQGKPASSRPSRGTRGRGRPEGQVRAGGESQRRAKSETVDEMRRRHQEAAEQRRRDDARRRAEYEEERRRTEEARRRYDEDEARRRAEEARRRAQGEPRETPGDRFRARWGTYSQPIDPARAKIIDRIKKLLRTATHPASNKNEAANAQAHADELMREHSIRAADIPDIWRRNRGWI